MTDNVSFKVGVDAAAAHKEMERMRDEIASLRNGIEKLTEKSKQGGRAGRDAYKGMGDEMASMITRTVGVTAVYAKMLQSIQAVIEKTKELRALRDESAVSLDASLNKVNKQFGLEGTDQDKMSGFIKGNAQAKKMKVSRMADLVTSGGNEGVSKEDFYSGKMGSVMDLVNVNENLTGDNAINLVQTGLKKQGKSFKNFNKSDVDKISKLYATMGQDIVGSETELGSLDEGLGLEESIVLLEMGKRSHYGKGKKSAADINAGYKSKKGGGLLGAIKAAGFKDKAEFDVAMSQLSTDSGGALSSQVRIQKSSREAESNFSENALQFATAESIQGEETQSAQMKRRKAKDETDRKNNAQRALDDTLGSNYGEENIGAAKELGVNAFSKMVPGAGGVFQLIKAITGTNKKIDLQNASMSQGLGKESINTKNDSKGVR